MPAGLLQVLDLHNQYYRITDQDADQRQHAEDRNVSEWRPARQHSRDDADQCKRSDRKHLEQREFHFSDRAMIKSIAFAHNEVMAGEAPGPLAVRRAPRRAICWLKLSAQLITPT